ncbi:MAG: hypothetical protein HYT20_01390 [Candidatus Nealsonbacteria bacterium]|nr:hypothetical protein [Candidatus Nealsonbacteria bacterium]
MNIFARFINSFEKPPAPKTPEEKDKDRQEWKKSFGQQAELGEVQNKAEEEKRQEQEKAKEEMRQKNEKEWKESFVQQAEVGKIQDEAEAERKLEQGKAEAELKKKQEKEWEEYFGDSAKVFKEGKEEVVKPSSVPEREPLMKTELDPEYVLGKDRAKLAQELGERMRAKSAKVTRAENEGPINKESAKTVFETKEGEKFSTERLTNPEDPRVNKVQEMLERQFNKEEVDSIETLKQAMAGIMKTGEKVPPCLVHVAENIKGEIMGVHTGAVCETVDAKGKVSEKSAVSLGFYTVVSPEMREKGVWKNLFKAYEKAAAKYAKERGIKINGYMAEAHDEIESPLNKQGAKRAYIKAEGVLFELPYEQPPVEWNSETGKPEEGAGTVPEHLMLKLASEKNKVSGKQIMEMVRGMYLYNNYREEEYFNSKEAHKEHTKFVKRIEQNLADFVAGKTVYLLSAKEREAMKKKGVQFSEYETGK